jgi:hypothetical protein
MPFVHGSKISVLLNGTDVSAFLNSVDQSIGVENSETTTFGGVAKQFVNGHLDGTVSASGFWDGAAGAIDDIMAGALGSSTAAVLSACDEGAAVAGNRALVVQAHDTSYQITSAVGDAVAVSVEMQVDGTGASGAYRGLVLAPLTSYGTSVDTSSIDNLASTANGLVANLHITSNSVSTTVKIQHSSDNVAWVDLITFTANATTGGEHKTTTGLVNRYLRVNVAAATGSRTLAVTAARK